MSLDDAELVRAEYADERRLAARKSIFRDAEGPDAVDVTFAAIAEGHPIRVLEVGCGEGELAHRIERELGSEVIAIDQSERMVELARARGVDARVGDVQDLPFAEGEFDCVVAAWMLYHVPDIDRALAEAARVLRPGGRLVAVTNAAEHLQELVSILGVEHAPLGFNAENANEFLATHFSDVDRRDVAGWVTFRSRDEAQAYVDASIRLQGAQLPQFDGPLRARKGSVVFVAQRP